MRKPDFFIVGAPKSGTTALADYLGQHPDIFMPANKDSSTFGSDLEFIHNTTHPVDKFRVSYETFVSWYRAAHKERRLGEASVSYLYSRLAAEEIHQFNPASQAIIMLRNPVDMIYSLHAHFLFDLNEDIEDIEQAIEAWVDRRQGRRIPPTAFMPAMLDYVGVAKYTDQVRRYFQVFGRENVHVIIFDDFREDTALAYRQALEFLGVDPSFEANLQVVNAAKRLRSRGLSNFIAHPPWPLRTLAERMSRIVWLRKPVNAVLLRFNTVAQRREPMDSGLRARLAHEFQADVERLSELLGRDLTHWTRCAPGGDTPAATVSKFGLT